jgi:L-ascorbate 6-phosphate lactonase
MTTKSAAALWAEIAAATVRPRTVTMWWLYQAGLALKTPAGTIVLVDPYLSNAVERSYGVGRRVPAPLQPLDVDADAILASHSHEDHLDPDSIEPFFSHPRTTFVGPPLAVANVVAVGVDPSRCTSVARGDRLHIGDLSVRAVRANHVFAPEPVPDAVGYVLEAGGVSVYHSGDTEYDERIEADTKGVTVSLVPINGTAGNLDVSEAAELVRRQAPVLAIPFHYGLWNDEGYGAGATLEPQVFVDRLRQTSPDCRTHIFEPATAVVVGPRGVEP